MRYDVVFTDFVYNQPYTIHTPNKKGLGGTESTVVRVATALAERGVKVAVAQLGRKEKGTGRGVDYLPASKVESIKSKAIVNLRDPRPLAYLAKHLGKAPKYVEWCHDLEGRPSAHGQATPLLSELGVTLITVSNWHKTHMIDTLRVYDNKPKYIVKKIYNPIEDDLAPDDTVERDPDKFVFLSSPHKGLDFALAQFKDILKIRPSARLHIANPGYYSTGIQDEDYIVDLGSLPRPKVIEHLRTAYCLFYPNALKGTEETYGLVAAEALATGTPVMIHPAGALREITSSENRFYVNGREESSCATLYRDWLDRGIPKAELKIPTRTKEVTEQWLQLIK